MAARPTTASIPIRSRIRETELAARNLIGRAAYMEKRANRSLLDSAQRKSLEAQAQGLRDAAAVLLDEISELSRRLSGRSAA